MCPGWLGAYTCAILACTKQLCTRRVPKHTFTCRKKRARKSSICQALLSNRSRPPGLFLRKGVLKTCSKFTVKNLTLRHGCSPVNLLHIFRTPFHKNTSGRLLLKHLWRNFFWKNSDFSYFCEKYPSLWMFNKFVKTPLHKGFWLNLIFMGHTEIYGMLKKHYLPSSKYFLKYNNYVLC